MTDDILQDNGIVYSFQVIKNSFIIPLHAEYSRESSEFEKFQEIFFGLFCIFKYTEFLESQGEDMEFDIPSRYIGGEFTG